MPALFAPISQLDSGPHHYRAYATDGHGDWLSEVAAEYVKLRTDTISLLEEVRADGIQVLATDELLKRIKKATIPERGKGNFDVVRSDFGEVLCYLILERQYNTRFGYKSLRERELTQQPGRGIDAVGVEEGTKLTVVLGETKVSSEGCSPPQVVDTAKDSLRQQHLGHLKNRKTTSAKIWDIARRVVEPELGDIGYVPSMIFFGVHRKEAVWLRMVGVPRVVADGLGVLWRNRTGKEPDTYDDIRSWVTDLTDTEWQGAIPANSTLTPSDMRLLWKEFVG